jgi:hypothetical protein
VPNDWFILRPPLSSTLASAKSFPRPLRRVTLHTFEGQYNFQNAEIQNAKEKKRKEKKRKEKKRKEKKRRREEEKR